MDKDARAQLSSVESRSTWWLGDWQPEAGSNNFGDAGAWQQHSSSSTTIKQCGQLKGSSSRKAAAAAATLVRQQEQQDQTWRAAAVAAAERQQHTLLQGMLNVSFDTHAMQGMAWLVLW